MSSTSLETLITPRRSCSGAFGFHLDAFAAAVAEAGYTPHTIRAFVGGLRHLGLWSERLGLVAASFDESTLRRFERHIFRCKCPRRWKGRKGLSRSESRGAELFLAHLRGCGVIAPAQADPAPRFGEAAERFCLWMARHRGVAAATLHGYRHYLRPFLAALGEDPAAYQPARIRAFVIQHLARTGRSEVKHSVTVIRAYLRFLVAEGRVPAGLVHCVPTVLQRRLSSLPRYLEFADIQRVIASCDVSTSKGLRDRAVLLLLARLGVRSRDIIAMTVPDVDWKRGTLRVRGKSRREVLLPLPQDVGDALLAYLDGGRPRSTTDRMFLTVRAPTRPFTNPATISEIVAVALQRAGIHDAPSRGAHLLRHSAATAMLRAGSSLETIGAVLRHQSPDTTALYAKVDLGMLGQVTQPWPGGPSC
jgi:site-specific recombinase XerD